MNIKQRRSRGEYIGPLLESTRSVYQLKLARLVANLASSPPKLSMYLNFEVG